MDLHGGVKQPGNVSGSLLQDSESQESPPKSRFCKSVYGFSLGVMVMNADLHWHWLIIQFVTLWLCLGGNYNSVRSFVRLDVFQRNFDDKILFHLVDVFNHIPLSGYFNPLSLPSSPPPPPLFCCTTKNEPCLFCSGLQWQGKDLREVAKNRTENCREWNNIQLANLGGMLPSVRLNTQKRSANKRSGKLYPLYLETEYIPNTF